jgi:hypothetical protein
MEVRHAFRRLRTAAWAAWLAVCLILVVLWLRTFWRADVLWGPIPGYGSFVIASAPGYIELSIVHQVRYPSTAWKLVSHAAEPNAVRRILSLDFGAFGLRRSWNWNEVSVTAPHWFIVLIAAACAALPLIKWQSRFTLRTMLATVTIVAFALWLFVKIRG